MKLLEIKYLMCMFLNKLEKSIIVSFEGIDGSGKTTIAKTANERLQKLGFETLYTEEPTKTFLGEIVREIILKNSDIQLPPITQALLFNADRNFHINNIILKAFNKKKIIIIDRFTDSTLAYQGENDKLISIIERINDIATEDITPDITFLLDVDPKIALERINKLSKEKDNFENIEFLEKVRVRYLNIAYKNKDRIKILDSLENIEILINKVINNILNIVEEKNIKIKREELL